MFQFVHFMRAHGGTIKHVHRLDTQGMTKQRKTVGDLFISTVYTVRLVYGGFQGGPQLGPPDAERRQSLGQQMLERYGIKIFYNSS